MSSCPSLPTQRQLLPTLIAKEYKPRFFEVLVELVTAYYAEDHRIQFDPSNLTVTLKAFRANPLLGKLELLQSQNAVVGYAILATFWSNEYGGPIVHLDELFIAPSARNQTFGRSYIRELMTKPPYEAVAIQLETTPNNDRAKALYKKLGFKEYDNRSLIFEISGNPVAKQAQEHSK